MKTQKRKIKSKINRITTISDAERFAKIKDKSGDNVFLFTLKQMGKPSLVREMAARLKNGRLIAKSKKKLMALLYASASHLNRDGIIKRTPVNNNTYKYSLLEWKRKYRRRKRVPHSHSLAA